MKKGYIGLWLLLVIALLVVVGISFSDDITIGNYTLKKAPFRDTLLADKEAEAKELAKKDSLLAQRRDSLESVKEEVDSVPQSILVIGDSMTLNLALRIAQYAKANGHTIHSVNWDSSGTVRWGNSQHLAEYIKEYGATFVFISLGSNELYVKDPKVHEKHIASILEQVGELPYIWIGPPNWKEDNGFNDYLETQVRPGAFFRSAGMEFQRKKDGIHPTREASALWVDSIARWMPKSAHPILFNTPPDSIGKVSPNIKYMKATDK